MNQPSDAENKMISLIPEFYYDLIGRVLPGAFIAFLYGWLATIQPTSFGTISLVVFLCYFLGLTLDVFTDRVFLCAHRLLRPLTKCVPYFRVDDDGTLWSWTRTLPASEQIALKKMFAEKVLFRIATFASFVSVVLPPPILQKCPYRITVSLISTGLFLFCVITMHEWISYIKRDGEKRKPET